MVVILHSDTLLVRRDGQGSIRMTGQEVIELFDRWQAEKVAPERPTDRLTVRDQIALAALAGLTPPNWRLFGKPGAIVADAYEIADAMLAARQRRAEALTECQDPRAPEYGGEG